MTVPVALAMTAAVVVVVGRTIALLKQDVILVAKAPVGHGVRRGDPGRCCNKMVRQPQHDNHSKVNWMHQSKWTRKSHKPVPTLLLSLHGGHGHSHAGHGHSHSALDDSKLLRAQVTGSDLVLKLTAHLAAAGNELDVFIGDSNGEPVAVPLNKFDVTVVREDDGATETAAFSPASAEERPENEGSDRCSHAVRLVLFYVIT